MEQKARILRYCKNHGMTDYRKQLDRSSGYLNYRCRRCEAIQNQARRLRKKLASV